MGISFIVFGVVVLIGAIEAIIQKDWSYAVGATCIGILVFGLTSLFSVAAFEDVAEKEFYEIESTEIYSVGIHDVTSGSFTLGCGSVNTEFVYTFYEKDSEGNYKLSYISCDKTTICETNNKKPCVVLYKSKLVRSSYMWSYGACQLSTDEKYVIYVPEGSVVQQFNITA